MSGGNGARRSRHGRVTRRASAVTLVDTEIEEVTECFRVVTQ